MTHYHTATLDALVATVLVRVCAQAKDGSYHVDASSEPSTVAALRANGLSPETQVAFEVTPGLD